MGAYQPLFNIAVEHAYFADLACKSLEFVPTDASIALLNKTGLILKSSQSGITVFYENDKMDILRLYAAEHFSLIFKVISPCFSIFAMSSFVKSSQSIK